MAEKTLVPEAFGPLQGVKIVSSGTLIAQPFGAALAATMGAEVIQIERPGVGDVGWRTIGIRLKTRDGKGEVATNWIQERRNVFCVSLDLSKPRGRALFLRLLERADIWMESSKAGTYQRWGLDDASVWKINPKLVITHVSSYGQHGHPDYIGRTSYDIVGQAFGGIMYQTGFPDSPPSRAAPWTGDYLTALFTLWSSLAGLTYARSFGKGQSIDIGQYEAIHATLGGTMVEYFQQGLVRERTGNRAQGFQPLDSFEAKDGWVVLGAIGEVYDRVVRAIGLDPADPRWQKARLDIESIEGIEFDAILRGWINERTVDEVVRHMNQHNVACNRIMSSKDMAANEQYKARDIHIEWTDEQVGPVKGIGIIPKFSLTPGKVFRGSVAVGHDNERVYGGLLGLKPGEIEQLRRDKVI
ncbi:MAG TPA: CoA transferase [Candidatus Binataceae bacterium]|jgi:crotonobetainyl-CoA:carnitine CoA-transferase CaiB-like acyl-CoA transferase|nr:CoA transferase [Candidatus Binataceae bacterium]